MKLRQSRKKDQYFGESEEVEEMSQKYSPFPKTRKRNRRYYKNTVASTTEEFQFRERRGRLNWRVLTQIDPYQIIDDCDLDTLDNITNNITFSKINQKDLHLFSEGVFKRIFQLSQLIIEYLIFTQKKLNEKKIQMEGDIKKILEKYQKMKDYIIRKNDQNQKLKKENQKLKKAVLSYQLEHGKSPDLSQGKKYNTTIQNNTSLLENTTLDPESNGHNVIRIKTLQEEIKELKDQLIDQKRKEELTKINESEEYLRTRKMLEESHLELKKVQNQKKLMEEQNQRLMKTLLEMKEENNFEEMEKVDLKVESAVGEIINNKNILCESKVPMKSNNNREEIAQPVRETPSSSISDRAPQKNDMELELENNLKIEENQQTQDSYEKKKEDDDENKKEVNVELKTVEHVDKKKEVKKNFSKTTHPKEKLVEKPNNVSKTLHSRRKRKPSIYGDKKENILKETVRSNIDPLFDITEIEKNYYKESCYPKHPYIKSTFVHSNKEKKIEKEIVERQVRSEMRKYKVDPNSKKMLQETFIQKKRELNKIERKDDDFVTLHVNIEKYVEYLANKYNPNVNNKRKEIIRKKLSKTWSENKSPKKKKRQSESEGKSVSQTLVLKKSSIRERPKFQKKTLKKRNEKIKHNKVNEKNIFSEESDEKEYEEEVEIEEKEPKNELIEKKMVEVKKNKTETDRKNDQNIEVKMHKKIRRFKKEKQEKNNNMSFAEETLDEKSFVSDDHQLHKKLSFEKKKGVRKNRRKRRSVDVNSLFQNSKENKNDGSEIEKFTKEKNNNEDFDENSFVEEDSPKRGFRYNFEENEEKFKIEALKKTSNSTELKNFSEKLDIKKNMKELEKKENHEDSFLNIENIGNGIDNSDDLKLLDDNQTSESGMFEMDLF